MKNMKSLIGMMCAALLLAGTTIQLRADNDKKPCCPATVEGGKTCSHDCCVKAAKEGKVCEKCHPKVEKK